MKKILTAVFFIAVSTWAVAQKPGHQIIVHIPGMKDSSCFLGRYYGDKQYIIDTVKSDAQGIVVFQGKEKLDGGLYLFVYPDKHYFEMIVDKEQHFSMKTSWEDPISDMQVKNSKDNEQFYNYLKKAIAIQRAGAEEQARLAGAKTKADSNQVYDNLRANSKQLDDSREEFIKTYPDNFLSKIFITMNEPELPKEIPMLPNGRKDSTFGYRYFKGHFWDNVDFSDNRLLRTPVFGTKLNKYIDDLTPKIPDSINVEADMLVHKAQVDSEMFKYVVWWITYKYETSKIMGMDAVFVHMVENYYMKGKAWWIDSASLSKMVDRARKIAPNLIGNTAPELALKDSSGKWQILSKVPAKYTILVFYDPDCGHCEKEMPHLKLVYDSLRQKGISVMVYAVNGEMEEDKWKKFIVKHNLGEWINVSDFQRQSNFRQMYDIYSFPVIYILDKNKKIQAKRLGVGQIMDVIDHLEKEKVKS